MKTPDSRQLGSPDHQAEKKLKFNLEGDYFFVPVKDNGIMDEKVLQPLLEKLQENYRDRIKEASLGTDGLHIEFNMGQAPSREDIESELHELE